MGFVYMVAQVPNNDAFMLWNTRLYVSIQKDVDKLRHDGYETLIMGDLRHVGSGEDGIPGNLSNVNYNGRLIQDFVSVNNMVIVNAKQEVTSGLFTRSAGGYSTILDYVLTSGGLMSKINSLTIDEHAEVFMGSDHAGLILEVE